jgi:hypothetical protein
MNQTVDMPISGEQLAIRWNIEVIDIIFIMINYGLETMDPFGIPYSYDEMCNHAKTDDKSSVQDFASEVKEWNFPASKVKEIEGKFMDKISEIDKMIIRGRDWMTKWNMGYTQYCNIVLQNEFTFVDPLGHPVPSRYVPVYDDDHPYGIQDMLFRKNDIDDFEKIHSDLLTEIFTEPQAVGNATKEKRLRHNQIAKQKCREIAAKLWKEDPTLTIVDMSENDKILEVTKQKNGKYYNDDTIRRWIKDLNPNPKPGRRPNKK